MLAKVCLSYLNLGIFRNFCLIHCNFQFRWLIQISFGGQIYIHDGVLQGSWSMVGVPNPVPRNIGQCTSSQEQKSIPSANGQTGLLWLHFFLLFSTKKGILSFAPHRVSPTKMIAVTEALLFLRQSKPLAKLFISSMC